MRKKATTALIPIPANDRRELSQAGPAQPAVSALAGFLSDNTKRAYGTDLKQFFGTEDLRTVPLKAVLETRPEDVAAFRDKLMAASAKPSTVARKLSAVRALFNDLMRRGAIKVNPADAKLVRSPKRPTIRKTGYLSWEEARELLRQPDRGTEIGKRDYAMMILDANTGLRRSELCGLKDENLTRQTGTWCLRLRGKGEKERILPFRDDVNAAVEAWVRVRPKDSEWLFTTMQGERFSEHSYWKMLKRYAGQVGIEDKVHPHALRAAYIAFLNERGTPVSEIQQLVGHSRGDTTLGYVRELDLLKSKTPKALEGLDGEH